MQLYLHSPIHRYWLYRDFVLYDRFDCNWITASSDRD